MRKKPLIIIGIIALALLCAAILIIVIRKNLPEQRSAKQLELGNRYLEEMDYEQAKIAFEEVIAIDPSNAEAYLGAARAYAGLGDYEGAVAVLQKGYEQTGDESLKTQLDEYEQKLEAYGEKLEQEIDEYMSTIPVVPNGTNIPLYSYTYLKGIYDEMLPVLYHYLEMNLPDNIKLRIYVRINNCYLSDNDMENAKKTWSQYLMLQQQTGNAIVDAEFDEYGRIIWAQADGIKHEYSYYENSSRFKSEKREWLDGSRVDTTDYEYDSEGRITKSVQYAIVHEEYGDDHESHITYENCFVYESATSVSYSGKQSQVSYQNGEEIQDSSSTSEWNGIFTYDEEGNLISDERYD